MPRLAPVTTVAGREFPLIGLTTSPSPTDAMARLTIATGRAVEARLRQRSSSDRPLALERDCRRYRREPTNEESRMNINTTAIDDSLPRTALNPAALADLVALAGDRAAAAEASRRLDPGVARAVVACGFARHFVPSRWGGTEGNFTDYVRAVGEVARADAATGWCAAVFASVARMAGYLPPEGQRFLWADGPDTLIAGALTPRGTVQRLNGGWRLSGKWPFISGIHYAAFTLVCCTVDDSEVRYLAVPASSYQIEPTWFNVGMSAT